MRIVAASKGSATHQVCAEGQDRMVFVVVCFITLTILLVSTAIIYVDIY
jgi:hypothetical protein